MAHRVNHLFLDGHLRQLSIGQRTVFCQYGEGIEDRALDGFILTYKPMQESDKNLRTQTVAT